MSKIVEFNSHITTLKKLENLALSRGIKILFIQTDEIQRVEIDFILLINSNKRFADYEEKHYILVNRLDKEVDMKTSIGLALIMFDYKIKEIKDDESYSHKQTIYDKIAEPLFTELVQLLIPDTAFEKVLSMSYKTDNFVTYLCNYYGVTEEVLEQKLRNWDYPKIKE